MMTSDDENASIENFDSSKNIESEIVNANQIRKVSNHYLSKYGSSST